LLGPETPDSIYIHTRTCEIVVPDSGYVDGKPIWGPNQNNLSNATNDRMFLHNVEINGDTTYTISARCKTMDACHSPVILIQLQAYHPVSGSDYYPAGQKAFTFSTAKANVWEEFSFTFRMPPDVTKMRIEISNYRQETEHDENMVAYIDNLYIGEGVSFEDPPSCKRPFNGEAVKVDELGNFYVKNDSAKWEWFFPFIVHGDNYRVNDSIVVNDTIYNGWKTYSEQGFNAIITGNADSSIDDAIDAGLRVVPHLGSYYARDNGDGTYGSPLSHLTARLNYIKNTQDSMNNLLAYFIDNEVHPRWDTMKAVTDTVMQWEAANVTDGSYNRIAPIYMNNGHPGLAPKYLSYDDDNNEICHVGDITSSYVSVDESASMRIMDQSNNQSMPSNISQINGDRLFRARIYGSIAEGARGMNYWRDFAPGHRDYIPNCYDDSGNPIPNCPDPSNEFHQHLFDDATDQDGDGATTGDILNNFLLTNGNLKPSNDITQVEWWDSFPNLVSEIYQMKDLIQQPHWTSTWGVSSCVSGSLNCYDANFVIGTRELENAGYIIVANYGNNPVTATITTSGLPFTDAPLRDFFDSTFVTDMTNSQFQITLPYNGVGVYKIDKYLPETPVGTCQDSINVSGNLTLAKEAAQSIVTNGTTNVLSGTETSLKGGYGVTLKPGFRAICGSDFKAHIAPCENACTICEGLPPTPEGVVFPKEDENESEIWVKNYPNPFREEVNLEFNLDADADTEIIITDVNGKTVAKLPSQVISRGLQMIQLSTKNWTPGVYFYQVQIKEQNTGILKRANGTLIKM